MNNKTDGIHEVMYIIDGKCWKCAEPLKVALIHGDLYKRGATTVGPESFSQAEVILAKSKGASIAEQFSRTRGDSYLANSCKCGTFIGAHYLFTDYFHAAQMGDYNFEKIEL